MANYKNKTGRGEVNFRSPAQTFNGKEIFLADDRHFNINAGGGPAALSRPFVARDANGTPNNFSLRSHLVFQLRGEPFGVTDVSGNNFPAIEYSGSLQKRLEKITHHHTLKTFEFKDNRILTLTASTDNVPIGNGPDGMIYRTAYGPGDISNEPILPYSGGGASGEVSVLSGWIYAEDYGANGSCIMEMVQEGTEKRLFGLILTANGELTWRFYSATQAYVNNFGDEFQQITTIKKIEKKKWYHFCVIMRGFPSHFSDNKHQWNNNGLDNMHQSAYDSDPNSAHDGPQVAIFLNGHQEEVSQANADTLTNFLGFTIDGLNHPIVFGRGLGDYDSGSGGSLAKDTVFLGRLSEVSWFFLGGIDTHLAYALNPQQSTYNPMKQTWRQTIAQSLMNATHNASSGYANTSERLLLKDSDSNRTYHPTVKRSNDSRRLGNNKIFFDDGKAQTLSGSVVHYPTKLVKNDPLRHSIYNGYIDGDLHIDGAIPSTDSYDTHYVRESVAKFEPFEESRVYIDSGSSFYQTGTLDSVIPGFDTPLQNKDVIVFSLGDARIANTDFAGNTFTTGSNINQFSDFGHTNHVPSMFYFNNKSKAFLPLSSPDGNFGGIKNASEHATVVAASGSIENQVNSILKELRLGFAPLEGQPLLYSEQDVNISSYVHYSDLRLVEGRGGRNNMKNGIFAKHTGSFTAMPNSGDALVVIKDLNSEPLYTGDDPINGTLMHPPGTTSKGSLYRILFDNSSTTHTSFTSVTRAGASNPSVLGLKDGHSQGDLSVGFTKEATLGLSGQTLDTLIPKISTLIDTIPNTIVTGHTAAGSSSTIRWESQIYGEFRMNYLIAEPPNINYVVQGQIDAGNSGFNVFKNTYEGWSLNSIRGRSQESALEWVGDGITENLCSPINDFGFPYVSKYHQDPDETVRMSDYISEPFLAEKIVISFDAEASTGYADQHSYSVFTNEAPTKYFPHIRRLADNSVEYSPQAGLTYPPAPAIDAYAAEVSMPPTVAHFSHIQYDIDETNNNGRYFIQAKGNNTAAGAPADFILTDYHFFILKQNKKSRANMSDERKGTTRVIAEDQTVSLMSFAEGLDSQKVPGSDVTNRELIHHSKILVTPEAVTNHQTSDSTDSYFSAQSRQKTVMENISGSFDLIIKTPGIGRFRTNASANTINARIIVNDFNGTSHVPLFDLPYTGSSTAHPDDPEDHEEHLLKMKMTEVTASVRIEKTFSVSKKAKHSSFFFLPAHPTDDTQTVNDDRPSAAIQLSNTMGGQMQTEEFGSRAFGPGNIIGLDGNSKSYFSCGSFDNNGTAVTSSIEVKTSAVPESTPTLLLPTDELIFGFQNAVSACGMLNPTRYPIGEKSESDLSSIYPGLNRRLLQRLLKPYSLTARNLKVELFGSYLRNSQPKRFELNQMLGSDVVHESIGSESVHDQFDIAPRGAFTGSYVDEVMSGSSIAPYTGFNASTFVGPLTDNSNFTDLARAVSGRASSGSLGLIGSLRRTLPIASSDKTELDSFVFDLQSMFEQVDEDGTSNYANDLSEFRNVQGPIDVMKMGAPLTQETIQNIFPNAVTAKDFINPNLSAKRSFSFHEFSTVRRVRASQATGGSLKTAIILSGTLGNLEMPGIVMTRTGSADWANVAPDNIFIQMGLGQPDRVGTLAQSEIAEGSDFGPPSGHRGVTAFLFGIGDGVSNAHVIDLYNLGAIGAGCINSIRGFKYGFSNVVDKKPKNIFRRDRYGQLRDMLEMAPNTAYIDDKSNTVSFPIETRFFADDGSISAPDQTSASNLSTNCTSSAPYFDRDVEVFDDPSVIRNRGPLNNQIADITIEI